MAPYSGSIPTITAAATSSEFVDFNELLHALDSEGTEDTRVLGGDNRLTHPRNPKKRHVSSFIEWARCFAVYSLYLSSHQPQRSTDLMAYLYLIATCHAEYNFSACMAYDIAFRRKAARCLLASWGQIDRQLYTFTGSGKAHPKAWCDHCLTSSHSSSDCPLFSSGGPAKKAPNTTHRPRQTQAKEICRNYNWRRCSRDDFPCHHVLRLSWVTPSHLLPHQQIPLGSSDLSEDSPLSTPPPSPPPATTSCLITSLRPYHFTHRAYLSTGSTNIQVTASYSPSSTPPTSSPTAALHTCDLTTTCFPPYRLLQQ